MITIHARGKPSKAMDCRTDGLLASGVPEEGSILDGLLALRQLSL